ncbi:40S ribosomal protein S5-1 [Hordeum vulgare]|nr:40S ribosomal protein S5-1 [Hordeum vulgare]
MASPKVSKDKFFEKVINPYLAGVLQHPQSIEMHEGVLHIRDVEGPKKTGSVEARLEAMEQQVFKCQGMVERGLNANHMMITEFTNKQKIDANDIGKHLSRLYDRIDHLQARIYDLQNQNSKQHRLQEEELKAREAKLTTREVELSQEVSRLEDWEKEAASRKALLDAQENALATAEEKKTAEVACFPDVKLELHMALLSLCRDGFDEPLATPEDDFVSRRF